MIKKDGFRERIGGLKHITNKEKYVSELAKLFVAGQLDFRTLVLMAMDFATPRWISVEDELPKGKAEVVAVLDTGFFTLVEPGEIVDINKNRCCNNITHWMPLPQPPKKGGEQ